MNHEFLCSPVRRRNKGIPGDCAYECIDDVDAVFACRGDVSAYAAETASAVFAAKASGYFLLKLQHGLYNTFGKKMIFFVNSISY